MLWHHEWRRGPINGLALYNGEKVWFECCSEGGWIEPERFQPDVVGIVTPAGEDSDSSMSTDEEDTEPQGMKIPSTFILYALPDKLLQVIEQGYEEWCSVAGHMDDHDPAKYKPYRSEGAEQKGMVPTHLHHHPVGVDVTTLTEVARITEDEFLHYSIPHEIKDDRDPEN